MTNWASPAGVMAFIALVSAIMSIGWNYKTLTAAQDEIMRLREKIEKLSEHQERITVLEVKLDAANRTLDRISLLLEGERRKKE